MLVGIYKHRHNCTWAVASFVFLLMWAWNPKLILATGVGAGLMLTLYRLQDWDWSQLSRHSKSIIKSSHGKLILAVGGGSVGALSAYTAAAIWAESENSWIAFSTIVQGAATLSSLGLLMWYLWGQQEQTQQQRLDRWLGDLTADESLKRLIAIRQLTELINQGIVSPTHQDHIREFFQLMLGKEKEATVRGALLEALQFSPPAQPVKLPLKLHELKKGVYQ
ncbi:MAG: hypothetical protein N5P05_000576 [Chroococcopsis gigantea SAG 12.99]|jgi:hypothetical protein|nr:ATP synthase subunit I [Chlorogloea purpurea SAG 13.99]MDV2998970.1 hypothetical protein [Chroococcopsis gigantea SAG 12.99]